MLQRFANDHPWLTAAGAWLLLGGWIPWIGGTVYYRAGILVTVLFLAVCVIALKRLRTLAKAEVKVTPGQFVKMLWRELWNRINYRRQWKRGCLSNKLVVKMNGTPVISNLRRLKWRADEEFDAVIYPDRLGIPGGVRAFQDKSELLRRTLGVRQLTITEQPTNPGIADVQIRMADVFEQVLELKDMPWGPKGSIEYGVRRNGQAAWVYAVQSVLISGLTRRGKSNAVRAMLASIQRHQIPTHLYVADPRGGVQMQEWERAKNRGTLVGGCIRVVAYETDPVKIKAMIESIGTVMEERFASMRRRGVTQHVPTPEEPLILVPIDESIPLNAMLAEGIKGMAGKIGYMGAGAAVAMWLLTQLSEKSIMGQIRDLLPQRLCFATKTYQQTDMALGDGASQIGALCHQLGKAVGIGFSGSEYDATYEPFKVPLVTDAQARAIAKGDLDEEYLRRPGATNEPWTVYQADGVRRFEDGTTGPIVLYVGKTKGTRLNERLKEHRAEPDPAGQEWRDYVWRFRAIAECPSEAAVLEREEAEIKARGPYWNIIHNGGNEVYPDGEVVELVPRRQRGRRGSRRQRPAQIPEQLPEPEEARTEPSDSDLDWWDQGVEGAE